MHIISAAADDSFNSSLSLHGESTITQLFHLEIGNNYFTFITFLLNKKWKVNVFNN